MCHGNVVFLDQINKLIEECVELLFHIIEIHAEQTYNCYLAKEIKIIQYSIKLKLFLSKTSNFAINM